MPVSYTHLDVYKGQTYSSWGAWYISLSANVTTIAAAGGNATLSTSATRSRTWQWNGTGAVSYTHLDVYKRQIYIY